MSTAPEQVSFRLLKTTYEVACPPEQRKSLDEAIKHLKTQMQKVHDIDANASMDRIAVVTALNLSHDCLHLSQESQEVPDDLLQRLDALSARVRKTLDQVEKTNLA